MDTSQSQTRVGQFQATRSTVGFSRAPRHELAMAGMKCFIGTRVTNGNANDAMFRVSTIVGDAFMCVSSSNYHNESRAVVEVDCAQFLALWLRETAAVASDLKRRVRDTWLTNERFHLAKEGFSLGSDDPVPLAEVSCEFPSMGQAMSITPVQGEPSTIVGDRPRVTILDGVIRTVWLASHAAECFPVECNIHEADVLQAFAGFPGGRWMTVSELLEH